MTTFYPLTNGSRKDGRYAINLEYCGHEKPHYVLRFCGEWVASSPFKSSMVIRAAGHRAVLHGAMGIEAREA